MATKQIPELPEATTAALSDLLVKRDDATGSDQKLPIQTFIENALGSSATDDSSVLPTPDTLAKRDSVGRVQSQSGGSGRAAVVHEDTSSAADAETVVKRDSAGRAEFEPGGSGKKALVHLDSSVSATANSIVKRNSSGRAQSEPGGTGNEVMVHADNTGAQPGDVKYTARITAPPGWLKADGAAVSRSVYSDLFDAIGSTFGNGDGSTTFNLPDLRGEFIRGWDQGRGADPESGRDIGSSQSDAIGEHTHTLVGNNLGSSSSQELAAGLYRDDAENSNTDPGSILPTGGPETRPRNIALLACIKF